ncbi:MAG TPA: RtcB family protein [Planctomycetota bacterium]|jgi:tRNA-splicing ligase RtcB|nr:RtcB family protein [Planctomycetota bacterium]OQC21290.1 MAG: RNA-splicing ligase RtcB [Planctomycetes bacterium ADurb.Bin069]HNR99178.1 RtcB family protein [Planctomycetota bacterium]HNU25251.1 RtcB family protein [Planctomycetota bacterium]HOE30618.1 RtcB family protein [Planctomycetota bacterium]
MAEVGRDNVKNPEVERVDDFRWRIPRRGAMRTVGMVYATEVLMNQIRKDASLAQVANVACLPGIVGASAAMPDMHWGYGFPIGGVAAFDLEEGVISPGGVGYDINCGVRLLGTALRREDLGALKDKLLAGLFRNIPTGVGSARKDFKLSRGDYPGVLTEGAAWAIARGYGEPADGEFAEESGCIPGADPEAVSDRAYQRGHDQLGTLGSGNHFVEVDWVREVFDPAAAEAFGLAAGQVVVFIHSGSRGFGHQVCEDYIQRMLKAARKYGIELPDKQLCCAPIKSFEGKQYLGAMAAAANYAFANRQLITHFVRETFEKNLGLRNHGVRVVYDICHNIAKIERHPVGGGEAEVCVHRKGATRAFGPGHPSVPARYRAFGQPVLVPGDMGRRSYVLAGHKGEETFSSCCHGAGRVMGRNEARRQLRDRSIEKELAARNISVRAQSRKTLEEEYPEVYKDVSDVVAAVEGAGLARKVARLEPLLVIKG